MTQNPYFLNSRDGTSRQGSGSGLSARQCEVLFCGQWARLLLRLEEGTGRC